MTDGKQIHKKYVYGIWDHEKPFLDAIDTIKENGLEITDAYSPFPVHGIDDKLGLEDSRIHTSGFLLGLTGTITALSAISWIVTSNYPTIFGGKTTSPRMNSHACASAAGKLMYHCSLF